MAKTFAFIIAFFLALPLAPATARAANADDANYLTLVDAALARPESADWKMLRTLYPSTSFFAAHQEDGPVKGLHEAADKAAAEKTPEAIKAFTDLMRQHMASIDAHLYALHIGTAAPLDFVHPDFEKQAARGLLEAIASSGDGQNAATAFTVLGVDEEIALMRMFFNFKVSNKAREHTNGHDYSVFSVEDVKTARKAEMYFRTDLPKPADKTDAAKPDAKAAATPLTPEEDAEMTKLRSRADQPLPKTRDDEYLQQVDYAIANPGKADWHAIRDSYVDTTFFRQHGGLMPEEVYGEAVRKAADIATPEELQNFMGFMRLHFGNIASHFQALKAVQEAEAQGKKIPFVDKDLEKIAILGLINDITATGDGSSKEKAFRTITLNEQQYVVQEFLKMKATGMALQMSAGHIYNVVKLQDPKTGAKRDAYFLMDDRMTQYSLAPKKLGEAPQVEKPAAPADFNYLALVDDALKTPAGAQWSQIRNLYPDTSFFKKIGSTSLSRAMAAKFAEAEAAQTPEADKALKDFARENFGSVGLHYHAAAYAKRHPKSGFDAFFEAAAFRGMLESVSMTGDGTSLATPFILISPEEESYFINIVFGDADAKPQFRRENGIAYSSVSVKNPKSGKPMTVYFVFDPRMLKNP
ncbi:MAG: DUF4919 domain-containing protein [Micavibrio sp.]|nr:DUF4919 domain-containing protein [Micavibrio sp.]